MRARWYYHETAIVVDITVIAALAVADVLSQPVAAALDASPRECRPVFPVSPDQFSSDHRLYRIPGRVGSADIPDPVNRALPGIR